ncbi:MAG TPA: ABC transporter ATP-binding protein [Kofleriaceae bacterium]|jgi:branched-chain amino acid transport system ATP-binding protein|nr:ABC transporter ATP-binding protein [Kofleriaceae bacterium]
MTEALRTEGLCKHWGGLRANDQVSLRLPVGARHALIGPNGAGKTTFVNLLTGVLAPSAGRVFLGDTDITRLAMHQRVRRGLVRTFQINTLFAGLTVLESVVLAICERTGLAGTWHRAVARCTEPVAEAKDLLDRLRLGPAANTLTRNLPYGRQRLLEIALALAMRPRVLLLDEPASGIPASESTEVFEVIAALPGDVTVLFIEHDMDLVFRFAQRVAVLVDGRLLTEGTPGEIAADPRVRDVYLGEVTGEAERPFPGEEKRDAPGSAR